MRKYFYACLILSICHCYTANAASHVYKCTASDGAVSFSDTGCAQDSEQDTHTLEAPMSIPGLSKSTIRQVMSKQQPKLTRVTVIADSAPPCGDFDPTQRRTDLVRKQVKSGMSQAEVESMFGKPLTQRSHNGIISATYRSAKGKQRSIRFDQHGCVP